MTPNIISGTVTRSAAHMRRTPNWLKVVYAAIAAVVVIVALALIFTPSPSSSAIPECELEDGSTQAVCIWDGGDADAVINYNHGDYFVTLDGE